MNPLLPFIMAGCPTQNSLPGLLAEAKALGIEAIEVGLPHSDPIADGPILQAAALWAITNGVHPRFVFAQLAQARQSPDVILFTYLNPLLQLGVSELLHLLRPTPIKALLVVDLPDDQEPALEAQLRGAGYPIIPLLAPTTSLARAEQLLAHRPDLGPSYPFAQRFVYVIARLGVTGTGITDLEAIGKRVAELRNLTDRPLAVGFGLSDPASLQAIRDMGATPVIGSALVQELQEGRALSGFLSLRINLR